MEMITPAQMKYLHAIVFVAVRDGFRKKGFEEVKTKQDAKDVCKMLFKISSIRELTKQQASELVLSIQWWAAQYLDCYIPDPLEEESYFNQKTAA